MPVKSNMSPLANTPVAVKLDCMLSGTVAAAGEICNEDNVDPSTTSPVAAVIDPDLAVIVTAPADCPVAVPEGETVATWLSDEVQVTTPFMARWLPSLKVPVAV